MRVFTAQDIREFWECGGWEQRHGPTRCYWVHDNLQCSELPNLNDLSAVTQALEWFCNHTDWRTADIRLTALSHCPWRVEIFRPSYQVDIVEAELHEAIISAVLKAKRSGK